MKHAPLISRLIDELAYPLLDMTSFEPFIKKHPYSILLFTEDATRFPESLDVAVILPEIVKQFPQLTPAVIDRGCEKELQGRYNFSVWPALVFLKEGRYLSTLTKIQNWDDYCTDIPRILSLEARRDPGIGIPVVASSSSAVCGH